MANSKIVKFTANTQGTGTPGNPLAGMQRVTISPDPTYRGGGKAPGPSRGAPKLPGKKVQIAPAKRAGLTVKT